MKIHRYARTVAALLILLHCGWLAAQSAHDAPPATQPAEVYPVRDLVVDFSGNIADVDKLHVLTRGDQLIEQRLVYNLSDLNIAYFSQGVAYLGVGVESPGEALRSQLKLPQGAGLVVNYVDEKGPSKDAVHKHDVLQKLDDQILVNSEQLATLVRMHGPDETVSLTVIREARPMTVQVKLAAKKDDQSRAVNFLDAALASDALISAYVASKNEGAPVLKDIPVVGKLYVNQSESDVLKSRPITFNDGELLACIDGSGNLVAIDVKSGSIVFHGPINTEEQWKHAPQLVRDKLAAWKSLIAAPRPATDPSKGDHE